MNNANLKFKNGNLKFKKNNFKYNTHIFTRRNLLPIFHVLKTKKKNIPGIFLEYIKEKIIANSFWDYQMFLDYGFSVPVQTLYHEFTELNLLLELNFLYIAFFIIFFKRLIWSAKSYCERNVFSFVFSKK